ncbi:hypothetical protein KR51_00013830 [Rubidibacter lacunae KORDI 51-2]|uniref:CHAT domain-containing protein n=1 Tax=Rubidibacter lacunae KORDI 51-2 TaxID=582515 RepID=U5DBZ2_9CHRO|nr:CHAT domain-containing protein [Rubidibacter lacunae]ERN42048.1 hypothetical protein KR51_00013830 [Rubidibacter lacunae KORDI 51-2]
MANCTRRFFRWLLLGLLGAAIALGLPLFAALAPPARVAAQTNTVVALLQPGLEHYRAQRFSAAADAWQGVVDTLDKNADCILRARALRYLSLARQHLGQWESANGAIAESLDLAGACAPDDAELRAQILNARGRLEWSRGDDLAAVETWEAAARNYLAADRVDGVQLSKLNQAQALQALGLSREASRTLETVAASLEATADSTLQAAGYQHLGAALRRIGLLQDSERALARAGSLATENDLRARIWLEQGNTYSALLNRALARGDRLDPGAIASNAVCDRLIANPNSHERIPDATCFAAAARTSYREAARLASPPNTRASARINILALAVRTGERQGLTELANAIATDLGALPPSRQSIFARLNFAQSLTCLLPEAAGSADFCPSTIAATPVGERLPDRRAIATIVADAAEDARLLADPRATAFALGQLGSLYELNGQLDAAEQLTRDALLVLANIQAPDIRYRWEWQLARIRARQGQPDDAIAAYQTAVSTLQTVRGDLIAVNPDVQFSFRDNVEPLYRELVNLLLRSDRQPGQSDLAAAIAAIEALHLAELENYLGCELGVDLAIDRDLETFDPRAALVYPIVLPDRLAVITQLPKDGSLQLRTWDVGRAEVEQTLQELRGALFARDASRLLDRAGRAYEWIVAPAEAAIAARTDNIDTLVFILDGYFRNIPVGVLYDARNDQYVVEKPYATAVLPGLQLFDLGSDREPLQVLAAGISRALEAENRSFSALAADAELERIRTSVEDTTVLLDEEFTPATLQANLATSDVSVLHVATHGSFSSDPEETFILTYNDDASDGNSGRLLRSRELDGLLRARVLSERQRLELLILSACQTAFGDSRAPLGLAGLAVRSGARSTLATLWLVSDNSTLALMEKFYSELIAANVSKAEALHRAQQQLAARPESQNPFDWGPYVLVGNWR